MLAVAAPFAIPLKNKHPKGISMSNLTERLPRWDLSNVYPGLDSDEFVTAYQDAVRKLDEIEDYLDQNQIKRDRDQEPRDMSGLSGQISTIINQLNSIFTLVYTLNNYAQCCITTDSYDTLAMRQYSKIQTQLVRLLQAEKIISGWLGSLGAQLDEIISSDPKIEAHGFYLREKAQQSRYLMGDAEADLSNKLSLSGVRAWGKLQGTITS